MANDNKKAKADPAPKSEAVPKDKSTSGEAVSKSDGGEAAAGHQSHVTTADDGNPHPNLRIRLKD